MYYIYDEVKMLTKVQSENTKIKVHSDTWSSITVKCALNNMEWGRGKN
jgi:hypothetical protein